MSSDNPIGNIFDKFLGNKPKNISDYLGRLTGMSFSNGIFNTEGQKGAMTGLSYLFNAKDKYNLLSRLDSFQIFEGKGSYSLGKDLSSKYGNFLVNRPIGPGFSAFDPDWDNALGSLFQDISYKTGAKFAYNASAQELYMLSQSGQQIALPLQYLEDTLKGSIVHLGQSKRGAMGARFVDTGKEYKFAQIFYDSLRDLADASLKSGDDAAFWNKAARLRKGYIGLGAKGKARLESLLGSPENIRGSSRSAKAAALQGTRSRILQSNMTGERAEIFRQITRMKQAKQAISTLAKTMSFVPTDIPFIPEGSSLTQAYKIALNVEAEANEYLAGQYSKLGVEGLHPIAKADYLTGDKGLVFPNKLAKKIFGSFAHEKERHLTKGAHQLLHRSPLTHQQIFSLAMDKASYSPLYLTRGETATHAASQLIDRRGMKLAVVDFNDPLQALLATEDSGMLLTPLGVKRNIQTQHLGSLQINSPDSRFMSSMETLLGADPRSEVLSKDLRITKKELDYIMAHNGPMVFWNKSEVGPLTRRQKAIRNLIRRSGKQKGVILAAINSTGGSFSMSSKYSGGKFNINFHTSGELPSNILEGIFSGVRATGSTVSPDHPLSPALAKLAERGVEGVIDRDLYEKMLNSNYTERFISVMSEAGRKDEAIRAINATLSPVEVLPDRVTDIPIVESEEDAFNLAKNYVAKMKASKNKASMKLAAIIEHGQAVSARVFGMESIAKTVRVVTASGSIRQDTALDYNAAKAAKLTPGKVKLLALQSKSLGFADPNMDPVFRTLTSGYRNISFSPTQLDFNLGEGNLIRGYVNALATPGFTPKTDIITAQRDGLYLNGQKLKDLPSLKSFSVASGGVGDEELVGTVLDKALRGKNLYLDLGQSRSIGLLGEGISNAEHRFVPLAMGLGRIGKSDGRTILTKDHVGYNIVSALQHLQSNPLGSIKNLKSKFYNQLREGTQKIVRAIPGKDGLLTKTNILHVKPSLPIRLTANRSAQFDASSSVDSIFDIKMSRKTFINELMKKSGMNSDAVARMIKEAETRDMTYVMLGADPSQRAEHLGSVFRLKFTDAVDKGKDFIAYLQTHPFIKNFLERDVDRDKIVMTLVESMMGFSPENSAMLESRIAKQSKMFGPSYTFWKSQINKIKESSPSVRKTIGEVLASFRGQKMWASLGYSSSRSVERLLPMIAEEGVEGLAKLGYNIEAGSKIGQTVQYMQALFKGQSEKMGAAFALNQYLFQAGVGKGKSKTGLHEVNMGLLSIVEKNNRVQMSVEQIEKEAGDLMYDFISGADKDRVFQAASYLLNEAGQGDESTAKVLGGLAAGATEAEISRLRDNVLKRAANLMGSTLGLGAVITSKIGGVRNVLGIMEDEFDPLTSQNTFQNRFVRAILGNTTEVPTGGDADFLAGKVIEKSHVEGSLIAGSIKEEIFSNARKIAKNKWTLPVLGIAAAVGAYGYATRPTMGADVARPVDTFANTDMGPIVPGFSELPSINTSRPINQSSGSRKNIKLNDVKSRQFSSRADSRLVIEDKISPINPWLIRQQMDKVSESDFVY